MAAAHHSVTWHLAGANVRDVQRMLGHTTAAMTLNLNGRLLDDDLTGVADALGKVSENVISVRHDECSGGESELLKLANPQ
jgi:hypothetical protein